MTERIRECVRMVVIGVVMAAATALFGASEARADPPGRVARLSYVAGPVSFSPAGDDQWAEAVLNRPLVAGDRLGGCRRPRRARIRQRLAGGSGAATSVAVTNIDDRTAQFQLQQGVLDLRVRQMDPGAIVEIDTPNLAFQVTRRAAIASSSIRRAARRTCSSRAVRATCTAKRRRIRSVPDRPTASRARISRRPTSCPSRASMNSTASPASATRATARVAVGALRIARRRRLRGSRPVRHLAAGCAVRPCLVSARGAGDWSPYHNGHWGGGVDPGAGGGSTTAPWGFAPFHYGRWAYSATAGAGSRAALMCVRCMRPRWLRSSAASGVSVGVSAAGPAIGWFPLAPREGVARRTT